MPSTSARRALDLALIGCVAYLVTFFVVALGRARFGFELEWMEGGMVSHAARLLDGQPIYAKPSTDFVPFFYTPLYPTVLAWLGQLFGDLTLGLARGVSIASTTVTLGLLFRIGQREASWRYGLLAAGLYAALFRTNGAFYDLARPDALFTALLAGAVYVAYYRKGWDGILLAAALFILGFFTKQTVSVFVPATGIYLLWRDWKKGLVFFTVAFGGAYLAIKLYDSYTDGWFWTYIFEGHQGHLFYWKNILMEYWRDVLFVAPLLLLLPLLWFGYRVPVAILSIALAAWWSYAIIFRASTLDYGPHMYYRELFYETPRWQILVPPLLIGALLLAYRARNGARLTPRTDPYWLLMFVAGCGASGLNHSTQWAYSNCFMLLSMFGAVLIALAVRDLIEPVEGTARWGALAPAAVIVQLVALWYSPSAQMPTEADEAALRAFNKRIDSIEGKVMIPAHPMNAWHRDGAVHVHQMGLQDVAFMGGVKDARPRFAKKEWAAIVVDERNRVRGIERAYYLAERFKYRDKAALRTKTGFLVRPDALYLAHDPVERTLAPGLSANFEAGRYTGWTPSGCFGKAPRAGRIQGRKLARCTGKGATKSEGKGQLISIPIEVKGPRLTFLMGGRGGNRVAVKATLDGKVIARHGGVRQRHGRARRVGLNLERYVGKTVIIIARDDDPKADLSIDDLRWAWPLDDR